MAGPRYGADAGRGVVQRVQKRHVRLLAHGADDVVEVAHDLVGRQFEVGQGVHGRAQAAHRRRLRQAVAHDVADDQGDLAAGQRDDVVPVAAHVHALAGRQIAGGSRARGQVGQVPGEQAALELAGAGVLGVEEAGPLQGLGDQGAGRGQQGAFLVGEPARVVEGDRADAEGVPGGRQREQSPGLLAGAGGQVGQLGVVGGELVGGGQEQGSAGQDRVPQRAGLRALTAVEHGEDVVRVADGADGVQPVALHRLHDETGRLERRQHSAGDRVHHVRRRRRLGEGRGQLPYPGGALGGRTLGGPAFLLKAPLLGDVGEVDGAAVGARHQPQVAQAPVRQPYVEAHRLLRCGGLPAADLQAGHLLGGGQVPQQTAEQLLLGEAEGALGLQVGEGDAPVVVHRQEAVAHVPQGPAEGGTGGPGFVAVPAHPDHPVRFALFVVRRSGAGLRPAPGAVQLAHPVLGLEDLAGADRAVRRGQRRWQVVGVDAPHPVLDLAGVVLRQGAVQLQGRFVPDQFAGADVPVPGADADLLQGLAQPLAVVFGLPGGPYGAGRRGCLAHTVLGPGDDGPQELPVVGARFAGCVHQDAEGAGAAVAAVQRQCGEAGAGQGGVRGVGGAGRAQRDPDAVALAQRERRGQGALLADDLPGTGEGGRQPGGRHQTQRGHRAPQVDHAAQRAQFAHRVLERKPEDLAFRDTGGHGAEQCQPSVHVADFTVQARGKPSLRKILTGAVKCTDGKSTACW